MILLDTHAVIWLTLTPGRMSTDAQAVIRDFEKMRRKPGISAVTLFEIRTLIRRARIELHTGPAEFFGRLEGRFRVFPVSSPIAIHAAQFQDPFPGDPMDRLITATAIVEDCTLITRDERIRDAKVCKTLW